ncbi:MAG TPA: DMT family transporter, partial [bacterium]|nr:DMT family transporter [bacterium]
ALLAAVIFAFYTVLSKRTLLKISPFTVNLVSFFAGSAANLIFIIVYGAPFMPDAGFYETEKIAAFIYLGFIVTGFGYVTFFETIKRFTALGASLIFLFKPAVAVVFAYVFLDERLSGTFFSGLLILSIATLLVLKERLKTLFKS